MLLLPLPSRSLARGHGAQHPSSLPLRLGRSGGNNSRSHPKNKTGLELDRRPTHLCDSTVALPAGLSGPRFGAAEGSGGGLRRPSGIF